METESRQVLITGTSSSFHRRAVQLLPAPDFDLRFASDASSASAIVQKKPFHIIFVEYDGNNRAIQELVKNLRWSGSPCRDATAVLLCTSDDLDDAEQFLHSGFSRILNPEAPDSVLAKALDAVLNHEPRFSVHGLVRIKGEDLGHQGVVLTQTSNLSTTGMLVRFDKQVIVGTRFAFTLEAPGLTKAIRGTASVVRLTHAESERLDGFAARFSHFEGDDLDYLKRFLSAQRPPRKADDGR